MPEMAQSEQYDFSAEVGRLLDLVVHSLYSEREIFLRELVANAADATDRRRFEALTNPALIFPGDPAIRIVPDKSGNSLRISDQGIGMSREELIRNLGTIARSGTRMFGESLSQASTEDRPRLIGQFGVGFYSAFMVADRVEVTSRKAGSEEAWTWSSSGSGTFMLAPAERAEAGTDVLLHLKSDAGEFTDPYRLETIVRKWADHITVPITIARDGKDHPANEGVALWRKPRGEVSAEDAQQFYRHLGNLFDTPWTHIHWRAEGQLEFYALLFIPNSRPLAFLEQERKSRLRLHVRRMFITNEAELLPPWLRFVQGIVDTEDLPLNVSRETLQTTPVLARIRRAVTGRVLSELRNRAANAAEYETFWRNFGAILKEGIYEDADHRADLVPLLRFHSSTQDTLVSLAEYCTRLAEGQKAIWYHVADTLDAARASVHLEAFRAHNIEVLLCTDPIDTFWPERMGEYEGKPLRSVTQATDADFPASGSGPENLAALVAALRVALGEAVSDVRQTSRLAESPCALATGPQGPDLHMQRLLRRAGRGEGSAPILEINPAHPLIHALASRSSDADLIGAIAPTLLDLARVQDGDLPSDPARFARVLAELLVTKLAGS